MDHLPFHKIQMSPSVEQCEYMRYYEANRIIRESISSLLTSATSLSPTGGRAAINQYGEID